MAKRVPGFGTIKYSKEDAECPLKKDDRALFLHNNQVIAYGRVQSDITADKKYVEIKVPSNYSFTESGIVKKRQEVIMHVRLGGEGLVLQRATEEEMETFIPFNPWVEYIGRPVNTNFSDEPLTGVVKAVFYNHIIFRPYICRVINRENKGEPTIIHKDLKINIANLTPPMPSENTLEEIIDYIKKSERESKREG